MAIRYRPETMDRMISLAAKHRSNLYASGHVDHFGRPAAPAAVAPAPEPATHDGYCMKCKKKVTVPTQKVEPADKRGVRRAHGLCDTCGTRVHRFVGKQEADALDSTLAQTGGV